MTAPTLVSRATWWRIGGTLLPAVATVTLLECLLTTEKLLQAMQALVGVPLVILLVFPLRAAWNLLAALGWHAFHIPAQLGAAEGAIVTVSGLFGVAPGVGLNVALLRRSCQIVTASGGLLHVPRVAGAAGNLDQRSQTSKTSEAR